MSPESALATSPEKQEICLPLSVIKELGTTDVKVLGILLDEGSLTVSQVSSKIGVDKGNVSKSSKKLEGKGLLNRRKDSGKYGKTTLELPE